MKLIFDGLKQYKPGEIAKESKEVQAGFNSEVSNLGGVMGVVINISS